MKKKKKKQYIISRNSDTGNIPKYLGQTNSIKKKLREHSSVSVKRYGRVVKEISNIKRSSDTGKFVSGLHHRSHEPAQFKGVRLEKAKNRATRSSSTIKKGTRIGGPKKK